MPGSLAPTLLLLAQLSAQPAPAPSADTAPAPEAETLKERLSDKASDEQRVDNCRVDPARRHAAPGLRPARSVGFRQQPRRRAVIAGAPASPHSHSSSWKAAVTFRAW